MCGRDKRSLGLLKEMVMGTVISIDALAVSGLRDYPGKARPVPEIQITALTKGCSRLLEQLGEAAAHVEVIKVSPWYGQGFNIFDIKVVLSIRGIDGVKVEANRTLESSRFDWAPGLLTRQMVSETLRAVHTAIKAHIREIKDMQSRWERLLPKDERK